ncbi:ATP-binding protein [Pseudomonas lopnurensis]|uniref:ATP-binding protein n=1 Tax=Pseudomonas lopnurensis TaxID=1477517 RepID=UPI0028AA3EF9|nr:ATP-binding protein [Pseudomonas lopnurensis]
MPDQIAMHFAPVAPDIDSLIDRLEDFFARHGLSTALLQTFALAFDEIVCNIAAYSYPDNGSEHGIDIRLWLTASEIRVEVVDDGIPFDPLQVADPDITASLEEREIGGLGIFLVRKLMDSVAYERRDERNHLIFTKQLATPAQAD